MLDNNKDKPKLRVYTGEVNAVPQTQPQPQRGNIDPPKKTGRDLNENSGEGSQPPKNPYYYPTNIGRTPGGPRGPRINFEKPGSEPEKRNIWPYITGLAGLLTGIGTVYGINRGENLSFTMQAAEYIAGSALGFSVFAYTTKTIMDKFKEFRR